MSDSETNAITPANIQENVISASLNGSMLLNFMLGVYTMIYVGTMYLYTSRNRPNQRIVLTAITTLYVLCFTDFIIQWYWLNQWMVVNGQTRNSIFLTTLDGPSPSLFVFDSFLYYGTFVVSDGLLIWRCYHVWGMSLRVIAAPLATFLAEVALFITTIALGVITGAQPPTLALSHLYNNIITSFILISLGTTVITTTLIGYRIHTTLSRLPSRIAAAGAGASLSGAAPTRTSGEGSRWGVAQAVRVDSSQKTFEHIMVMIIESAAAYSVILIIYAVFAVVPSFNSTDKPEFFAGDYIEALTNLTAGIAPTILIARVALTTSSNNGGKKNDVPPPTTPHMSALKFGSVLGGGHGASSEMEMEIETPSGSGSASALGQGEVCP